MKIHRVSIGSLTIKEVMNVFVIRSGEGFIKILGHMSFDVCDYSPYFGSNRCWNY